MTPLKTIHWQTTSILVTIKVFAPSTAKLNNLSATKYTSPEDLPAHIRTKRAPHPQNTVWLRLDWELKNWGIVLISAWYCTEQAGKVRVSLASRVWTRFRLKTFYKMATIKLEIAAHFLDVCSLKSHRFVCGSGAKVGKYSNISEPSMVPARTIYHRHKFMNASENCICCYLRAAVDWGSFNSSRSGSSTRTLPGFPRIPDRLSNQTVRPSKGGRGFAVQDLQGCASHEYVRWD